MARWRYDLGVVECEALASLAAARGAFWRARGVRSKKIAANRTDLEIDTLGAWGEYGACMLLGIPFNWAHDRRDNHIDGRWRNKAIQIKSMPRQGQDLKFYDWHHFRADIAFAVHVSGRTVVIEGWATRDEFLERGDMRDYGAGYGLQPCVPASSLHGMERFEDPIPSIVTRVTPEPQGTLYERIRRAYVWSSDGVRCSGCHLYDPNPNGKLIDFARSMHFNPCRYLSPGTEEIPLRVAAVERGY